MDRYKVCLQKNHWGEKISKAKIKDIYCLDNTVQANVSSYEARNNEQDIIKEEVFLDIIFYGVKIRQNEI